MRIRLIRPAVARAVDEFVVDAVIKLAVIVDLVLAILVAAAGCEADHLLLVLQRRLIIKMSMNYQRRLHSLKFLLIKIGIGAVEGG